MGNWSETQNVNELSIVVYFGFPWVTLITLVTLVFFGVLWFSLVFFGLLWFSLVYFDYFGYFGCFQIAS